MAIERFQVGDDLVFMRDLPGVCPVREGDKARYLGDGLARIFTGPSMGWVVTLDKTAPVRTAGPGNVLGR